MTTRRPAQLVATDIYDTRFPRGFHRHIRHDRFGRPVMACWLPNDRRLCDPATGLPRGWHRLPEFKQVFEGGPEAVVFPRWRKRQPAVSRSAISVFGNATTGGLGGSATLQTHQVGDLFLGFATRYDSTTPPTVPGDFTTIHSAGANNQAQSYGWKIADTTSETSGTWTGCQRIIVQHFRGCHQTVPIGNTGGPLTGNDGLIDYPGITLTSGESGLSAFGLYCSIANDNATINVPSTFTSSIAQQTTSSAGRTRCFHKLNNTASYGGENNNDSLTGARFRTFGIELKAA